MMISSPFADMSLLNPAEAHSFQSFLTSMDYSESASNAVAPEWGMYASQDFSDVNIPQAHGKEALAKATKDLMSLDGNNWSSGPSSHRMQIRQEVPQYDYYSQHQQQIDPRFASYDVQDTPFIQQQQRRNVTFPFLSQGRRSSLPNTHSQSRLPQPISIAPLHTLGSDHRDQRFLTTPTNASSASTSFLHGSRNISGTPGLPSPVSPPLAMSTSLRSSKSPSLPGISSTSKRRSLDSSLLGMPSAKKTRSSPPYPSRPASSAGLPSTVPSAKPSLLTASQKKANHIQSEQKRRANIRRGYEALCETVPALREAIRAEEEAQAKDRASKPKRSKKSKAEEGDRADGRAGPRSENVVLVKTIDYIASLKSEQFDLLSRLQNAKRSLSASDGGRIILSSSVEPLWEREWNGGEGATGEEDEEEDE